MCVWGTWGIAGGGVWWSEDWRKLCKGGGIRAGSEELRKEIKGSWLT